MNSESRVSVRWPFLAVAAVALLALGAGGSYQWLRTNRAVPSEPGSRVETTVPPAPPASGSLPDVVVSLEPSAIERAGITVTTVTAGATGDGLRAPGVVEPDGYTRVSVTPLIGGRITRVSAELGQRVQRGQTLAEIFSPELAELHTRYISARAQLEAHEQELARTEKLVQIGGASRQELERIHAEHTARRADVQSAASRLQILGLSAAAIETLDSEKAADATVRVPSPIAGVVTERAANVGLNVDQATQLFTVVDITSVWVVADLYEKDFSRVRVGTPARITTAAYPNLALDGRVSYIDPQVSPATRTAKVRVEVPNARAELRFGMYAEVLFGDVGGNSTPMVPRSAVQNVGDRTVVYVMDVRQPGKFVEREVGVGAVSGDRVSVLYGVDIGDKVVGVGSFHLRAERERLGRRQTPTR